MPAKHTLLILDQRADHGDQCKVDREREPEKQQPSNEEVGREEEDMMRVDDDAGDKDEKDDAYSGGSPSSDSKEKSEFSNTELSEIRKLVQCPICLGIIKKTRTVMECLHRFCRECIDKAMRLGNNECPACRKHCASRRSLRDDPSFDALIAYLYPNIDQYEEEELALCEEDRSRNQQIQASIAQVSYQQSEALVKPLSLGKHTSKRKRNPTSEDHKDDNYDNGSRGTSSSDDQGAIFRPCKRTKHTASLPSSSVVINDGNCFKTDSEACKESRGKFLGHASKGGLLAWGKGCTRSRTRRGGSSGEYLRARLSSLMKDIRFSYGCSQN